MPIIDAQVHVWAENGPERPWVPELVHYVHRPHYTPEELLADMRGMGTDATVLVPPHWDAYRNDLAIEAARRRPNRFAVMCLPDLDSPSARDDLDRWLADDVVKGVRVAFWDRPSSAGLERGTYEWLWTYLQDREMPTAMYVPLHLGEAERIARQYPGLPIALCHLAMYHRQRSPSVAAVTARLVEFAKFPNVSLKASALPTPSTEPAPYADLQEAVERLYAAFGPERIFWGTDVTRISNDGYSYAENLRFMANLSFLDRESRGLVMGGAIQRWLSWRDAGAPDPRRDVPESAPVASEMQGPRA